MKKALAIAGIVLLGLALLGAGGFLVLRREKQESEVAPTPKQEGVLLETPLEERPYVTLTPRADGKEFTLDISRIKNAETIEYELVYLADGLSRGAVGSVDLKGGKEVSRKLLLGTCSKDVCRYDEGVEEGTLTLRFRGEEGTRKFVSDFHLQYGESELTSKDGKFKIGGRLSPGVYYITMSTIGLPGDIIGGAVVGELYGSFSSGTEKVKDGQLVLEVEEEIEAPLFFRWSGSDWGELGEVKTDGNIFAAEIGELGTFVVIAGEVEEE